MDGRLLARNGAVTLINDTVTRSQCATPPGPGSGPGLGPDDGTGDDTGTGPGSGPGPDLKGPLVELLRLPGVRQPPIHRRGAPRPPVRTVCTTRDFTVGLRARDRAGIRMVSVYLDGGLVKRSSRTRFSLRIEVRGLRVGRHQIKVVALDRAGNRSVTRRVFGRCALALTVPRFTG
ncbi:MAG: Ig-like domain-containing protein [Solirubrobacteraceae bacterium]